MKLNYYKVLAVVGKSGKIRLKNYNKSDIHVVVLRLYKKKAEMTLQGKHNS